MDVSFLFSVTACFGSLLYVCTLFLTIQYRGDFGLIADVSDENLNTNIYINSINSNINTHTNSQHLNQNNNQNGNNKTNFRNKNKNSFYENQNNNNGKSVSNGFEKPYLGIFDEPLTDFNLLFSSSSNSNGLYNYGNKSNNLKINLKDV